ncbi:IS4 family transposase [Kitasatospora aureofaciens]|uniref:IS4 family transposase n=1 Tax=Kitasatospora aureofaciens TaxID=1894 RepID=UPI0027E2133A|nr:IS4 family transposase [Kitasatospora aureofaciens]
MSQRAGGLPDQVSIGVLAASVPRDVVDEAVAVCGRQAQRTGGKLPPHLVVYFAMALALFGDDDYEEVMARLTQALVSWGSVGVEWVPPTTGGITQARQRMGAEVLREVFERVAEPVADLLTPGAFLGPWRLMAIDGVEWDVPDSEQNAAAFGYPGGGAAFPKARLVSISECASHAHLAAAIGPVVGEGSGEQSLARQLYPALQEDQLLLADSNFYSFEDWRLAAGTGAQLLWRVGVRVDLPLIEDLGDGSYLSLVFSRQAHTRQAKARIVQAAREGRQPHPDQARLVRVIEYDVPDRGLEAERELICLITTITDPRTVTAERLARAYHDRWEHEVAAAQLKTTMRGPGRILRSKSPDLIRQEIYGYLLTHHAISALICRAATHAGIDPDRVKFTRTLRIVRRHVTATPAAFPP